MLAAGSRNASDSYGSAKEAYAVKETTLMANIRVLSTRIVEIKMQNEKLKYLADRILGVLPETNVVSGNSIQSGGVLKSVPPLHSIENILSEDLLSWPLQSRMDFLISALNDEYFAMEATLCRLEGYA